jgi:predicted GTPase
VSNGSAELLHKAYLFRAVIDVVDLERQGIYNMLKNSNRDNQKVIGVINKCDTKQEKSHDFVVFQLQLDTSD